MQPVAISTNNDESGPQRFALSFLTGRFVTSLKGNDDQVLRIPTAPKQLHALVVFALNPGQLVSGQRLREVLYPSPECERVHDKILETPLSQLRKAGWPIAFVDWQLEQISSAEVDILHFHTAAQSFITAWDECRRADRDTRETLIASDPRLLEGAELFALWQADPAEPFKKAPRVAKLFEKFSGRYERFLAAYVAYLIEFDQMETAHQVVVRLEENFKSSASARDSRDLLDARSHPPSSDVATPGEGGAPAQRSRPSSSGSARRLRASYLHDVSRRGAALSFGDPSSGTADEQRGDHITLEQVWTPLRVADSKMREGKQGTHESMAEGDLGTPLLEVFDSLQGPVVLLGEPGGGKSTSIAMMAARLAAGSGLLPIWVNLGAIVPSPKADPESLLLSGVPEIELAVTRRGEDAGRELTELLEVAILEGRACLLLDGLDEVKDHALEAVRAAVSAVARATNGCRVVVTCRKFDYRQLAPNRRVQIERELELLHFNDDEKVQYVERWYRAAALSGAFSTQLADRLSEGLKQELRTGREISEMAELPLLLALLTLIHSRQELPDSRSVVCDTAIRFMLSKAAPWREREPGAAVEAAGPIVRLAVEVAYSAHLEAESRNAHGALGISKELIEHEARKLHDTMRLADPGHVIPSVEELTSQFLNSHGLLLETSSGRYKFAHKYFQEFLAGQHYARGADRTEALARGNSTHWREPFRLMASFAGHDGQNLYFILDLIGRLLTSDDSIPSNHLGAEMLAEVTRRRLALWGFESVLAEPDGLWPQARRVAAANVENPELTLPERERSGTVLSLLGDPRFVDETGRPRSVLQNTVAVKRKSSRLGTRRLNAVDVNGGYVAAPRRMRFAAFDVGKYPVTNVEYGAFIADGGYQDLTHWTSTRGRAWVSGDRATLDEISAHWMETVHTHHAKEIRDGEIKQGRLREECERRTAPRVEPYFWRDRRFNQANQPVVGVNYWEAVAFCTWATARGWGSGQLPRTSVVTLPTEFEWEHASRPADDDRIFPWGNEWDDERAHVSSNVLNMRQPTPVGIYLAPAKNSPSEMAGNVWEWTASLSLPYDDESADVDRLDDDSLDERIVRGCSWYNPNCFLAACSARCVDRSYNLFYDVGFRIVVVDVDAGRSGCA